MSAKDDLAKLGGANIAQQGGAGPEWRATYKPLGEERAVYDREAELNKVLRGS